MGTKCYAMVRGQVARFTLLDHRGNPVEGQKSVIVTSGITKVAITEVVTDQPNEMVRNDQDQPRLLLRGRPKTMGYALNIDLCGVDPDLISMITNQPTVVNASGVVSGNEAQTKLPPSNFAMEVWSKLATPVDGYHYGYTLFPRIRGGRVSGFTFGNAAVDFSIGAAQTFRMSRWGLGPHVLRWSGNGWDMAGWDTGPWDGTANDLCNAGPVATTPTFSPFGESKFGEDPFGGGNPSVYPIFDRQPTLIGSHTHWRTFLLSNAPAPRCGAQPLYDSIDGGSSAITTADVLDGEFVSTSPDAVDGGRA